MIVTSVPYSDTFPLITAGIPNCFLFSKHSFTNSLYRGSKIWRFNTSPGYTTTFNGNIGMKFVMDYHLQDTSFNQPTNLTAESPYVKISFLQVSDGILHFHLFLTHANPG